MTGRWYRVDVKRRLLIVAVFLLAGAVGNVAVAWGIALKGFRISLDGDLTPSERTALLKPLSENGWRFHDRDGRFGKHVSGIGYSGMLTGASVVHDGFDSILASSHGMQAP